MHRGQSTLDRPYPTRTLLTSAPARRRAGYDTFTVKFIETEGKCGVGYATGATEEDTRRSEAEFVSAFDDLLRNQRDQVPPHHFYERLLSILVRPREAMRFDDNLGETADGDDGDGDDADDPRHPPGRGSPADDRRLVRAAADVFARIQRQHPTARVAVVDIPAATGSAPRGEPIPYVEACDATWTPLDSDKRAGSHADVQLDAQTSQDIGIGKEVTARGGGADWRRFRALVKCVGGDPAMLDVLCLGAKEKSTRRSSRKNGDTAGDDLDDLDDEEEDERGDALARRKGKGKKGGKSAASEGADAGPYPGYVPPRLGACLLFQHSVDVLAADAAARIAVFERRVAMQNETDAAAAAAKSTERSDEPTPSRLGRPSVPGVGPFSPDKQVPDSQDSDVVPESPDAAGTPSQKQPPVDLNARGNWALGVLQNSLLYRLVGLAPSPAEGAALIQDIFELAGFAAENAFRRHSDNSSADHPPCDPPPGCEDAGVDAIGASAHLFLSRLGDLLDLMEPASGTSDRRLTQLRQTVDEAVAKFWRCTGGLVGASRPDALSETEAKRAFMASMCGGATNGGTTSVARRRLRLVRSALRQCVVARQAPGIMIAGLGREKDGEGARDVFDYVARDAKTAIKSQKTSEGSADFHESVGRLSLMIGAAAQAAAALSDTGKRTYEGSLRAGVKAFVEAAIANDGLRPEIAACVTAAIGTVTAA